MNGVTVSPAAVGVAVLALLGVAWYATRPGQAAAIGSAAVGAAAEVGSGVVLGVGDVVGVPRTDADQCTRDIAAGRTWDASFSCPASRFISEGLFGSNSEPPAVWGSETRVPAWSGGASSSW